MTKDLSDALSQRVQRIKPSPTLAVSARAEALQAAGKDIINLGVGEPDFDTPEHIKEAAIRSIQAGHTKYTAVDGIVPLKEAIRQKLAKENKLQYELNQIIVSCGAKHSLYNLFEALLNPGDEMIIPAPYWVSYPDMVKLVDAQPVIIKTNDTDAFKLQPEQLARAITPKTRLLLINSPSNPTGMAYTAEELRALGDVLKQHPHVFIVSDDIYEHSLWNHLPFTNIVNACPELYDRTFVVNGVSKSYAMTGWRIGYTAGPDKVIAAMKKVQSQSTSNPTSVSQDAAIAALTGDQSCIRIMTQAYKERHDYVYQTLQTLPGIRCLPSDGTFYTFPNIEGLYNSQFGITDDLQFAEFLLNEVGLAVIPGAAFDGPGHIRICFTTSMGSLQKAMQRLQETVAKLTANTAASLSK